MKQNLDHILKEINCIDNTCNAVSEIFEDYKVVTNHTVCCEVANIGTA